jgi:hypothetical protein
MSSETPEPKRQQQLISDIEALVRRKPVPDSPVLSVYLDIDQNKAANLNRRFEVSLKDMLRSIEARVSPLCKNRFGSCSPPSARRPVR